MGFTRRQLLKIGAGAGIIGSGVTFKATQEESELDFNIESDGVSGEYRASGEVLNLTYDGEDQLDEEAGTYEMDMDESLFSAEVANTYAVVDIDRNGEWMLSVGLESGDEYKDISECEQSSEDVYADTVEAYGAEIDNGTIRVQDNMSSSDHADGIAGMLEEGVEDDTC